MKLKKYKFIISIVLKGLYENRLRTILTVLTNLIGMTAILIVILISSSLNHKVEAEVATTKKISFLVTENTIDETDTNQANYNYKISEAEFESIKSSIPGITEIGFAKSMPLSGGTSEVGNPPVLEGTNFDNENGDVVIYNNTDLSTNAITDGENVPEPKYKIGDYVTKNARKYKIIGTSNEVSNFGTPVTFFIPDYLEKEFTTANKNIIEASFSDESLMREQAIEIKNILLQHVDASKDVYILDSTANIRRLINSVTLFFIGLGSISLIVSLVAIINMLFVSVNERKSKIAILRALGMQKLDIAIMFVIESLFIILSSTLISSIFAGLITAIILSTAEIEMFVSVGWILFTIIFAMILAVLAAVLPASNSAKTNISIILR